MFTIKSRFLKSGQTFCAVALLLLALSPEKVEGQTEFAGTGGAEAGRFSRPPFKTIVTLRTGYDDNVLSSSVQKEGSFFTDASLGFEATFGTRRTNVVVELEGGATYFATQNIDLEKHITLTLNGTHRINPRFILTLNNYAAYQVEPDFNIVGGRHQRAGQYLYTNTVLSADYLWTRRFRTITRYSVISLLYDDDVIGQFENRFEQYFSNEFRYLVWPTTAALAEYRLGVVTYTQAQDFDFMSHFFLLGADHKFNPRLTVVLRGGAEMRTASEGGNLTSPYFESSVNFRYQRESTVQWNTRFGLEQSDRANAQTERTTFRTGLQVNHALTGKLTAYLGAFLERNSFTTNDLDFSETIYDVFAGVRWRATRRFSIDLAYGRTQLLAEEPFSFREFDRNRYVLSASYVF